MVDWENYIDGTPIHAPYKGKKIKERPWTSVQENALGYGYYKGNYPGFKGETFYDENTTIKMGANIVDGMTGRRDAIGKPFASAYEDEEKGTIFDPQWLPEIYDKDTYIRSSDKGQMHPWAKDNIYEKLRDRKNKTDVEFL